MSFPLKSSDAYIENNGKRSTLGKKLSNSDYQLPTATSQVKGGVKIGSGLTMSGETLSADAQIPEHTSAQAGKVLKVGDDGDLEWDTYSSVNWMTQSQWNALTFAQKKANGFTAIGTEGAVSGNFFDFSSIEHDWAIDTEIDNIVHLMGNTGFSLAGFFSTGVGDRFEKNGRGGTRSASGNVFICNASYSPNNDYCTFLAFADSAEKLACTNTSYYTVIPVEGYSNLYVGGLFTGSWPSSVYLNDVKFTKSGETLQNLNTYFNNVEDYTLRNIVNNSDTSITIPNTYASIINSIIDFLSEFNE